ncbi:DUF2934 domain-containing protein [Aureimonas psammosilenae]|uniref:DUF2934 domain-containing protein n=1 Tax=Aureimonas psammosilenae TaxID=2495496 RepID=UPI001AEECF2B|nr:DUF2934 domain-containing protein [Aureimonas psammosilenae]
MIRSRAHELWLDEGQPDGRALDHWLTAQREQSMSDVASPWFDRAVSGNETTWMRHVLWSPQPFVVLN